MTHHARILALGTAVPRFAIEQRAAAEVALRRCCTTPQQLRLLPTLYRRAQVARRGSVLLESREVEPSDASFFPPAEDGDDRGPTTQRRMKRYAAEAPALAVQAARAAGAGAALPPESVTHLITVSCTGFAAPGIDTALIKSLGLSPQIARTHIGFMGCHGAFNALRVAAAFAQADPDATVLVCAVELCTLHFRYGWDPEKIVANALFADGAAAAVVGSSPENGNHRDAWRIAASGSCIFPESHDAMTWHIADHGFEMTLSSRVPDLIQAHLRPWMAAWLATQGLSIDQIGSWAVHPGGPRILAATAEALGLPAGTLDPSQQVLAEHGNMSSPTVLFIIERLRAAAAPRPCVALGFGPGLAAEATLLL